MKDSKIYRIYSAVSGKYGYCADGLHHVQPSAQRTKPLYLVWVHSDRNGNGAASTMRYLSFVLLLLGCYGDGIARAQTTNDDVQIDLQPCILAKSEIVSSAQMYYK